jgi:hypothetical protein
MFSALPSNSDIFDNQRRVHDETGQRNKFVLAIARSVRLKNILAYELDRTIRSFRITRESIVIRHISSARVAAIARRFTEALRLFGINQLWIAGRLVGRRPFWISSMRGLSSLLVSRLLLRLSSLMMP